MPQRRSFFDYVGAAFNARPFGMFVAPNWVGLTALGLLGFANPGFWVLGAGLELGYLALLSTNPRFRRVVDARESSVAGRDWQEKIGRLLDGLGADDRRRYESLAGRCRAILDHQQRGSTIPHGLQTQSEGLSRLLWIYLRLLAARQAIEHVLDEAGGGVGLDRRVRDVEAQLDRREIGDDLRRSLAGQLEILRQRQAQQVEARQKLGFLEAELVRIQEQVELIREQAALSTDPELLSQRIDQIAATLGGTSQWVREQQEVFGAMEDLITEPPPLITPAGTPSRARASQ
jgi:hypothetical protein